ncbi:MAG: metal-dependent transcriptional regulator [Verrucomicrobiae bacterium]|nr:metal-dependent transcriptional regulator [Verrucomicrobiae bacterium]
MPSSTVEDYLKSILRLDETAGREVTVGGIAEDLGVTPGTVSSMMRHLSEAGLVDYVPRRSVTLRKKGRTEALRVVRRHRLVETFLVTVMKLDWSEVHEEAEVLEHVISDRLLERMDEMLGHPSHDPHGDPIPDPLGNFADDQTLLPLSDAASGAFRVVRVSDSDPAFLDWLREHRLQPGCEFELSERDPVAGVVEIRFAGKTAPLQLGEKAAARILVESAAR